MKYKNVLLITSDQARIDAISCNADKSNQWSLANVVKTPNLDTLAAKGVTFRNSFTANPICVPGRATITTGRYSHKCASKANRGRIRDNIKIAEYFTGNGFATCAIGKLHYLPYSPPGEPRVLHGFQYAELCEEGRAIAKFDPDNKMRGIEDYHDYLHDVGWGGYERAHGTGNNDVHPATSVVPAEHHEEAWVAKRSIAWLEKHFADNPEQPFMMWSSFIKPHPPYDPPVPYDRMYDPREMPAPLGCADNLRGVDDELYLRPARYNWDMFSDEGILNARAHYCGMMSFQDAQIGKIIDFLREKNELDNTVILYTADHGDLLGDYRRFFKQSMHDGSVMVPFIVCDSEVRPVDDSHVREQLVGSQDVLPTLCSLAGLDVPSGLDGVDISPAIADPEAKIRDYYISQTGESPKQKYMIRTAEWKYIYCQVNGTESLFKIGEADYETYDLSDKSEYHDILLAFRNRLINWCRENGDSAMIPNGKLAVGNIDDLSRSSIGWNRY
jgi:arylsulfatase A-like enzyme